MLAFGLGSGIAGLGGVALSQVGNVGPDLGQSYIVDSFMVVVLGGVGQLAGTRASTERAVLEIIDRLNERLLPAMLEPPAGGVYRFADAGDCYRKALDIRQARLALDRSQIRRKVAGNQRMPRFDFFGSYGMSGLGPTAGEAGHYQHCVCSIAQLPP